MMDEIFVFCCCYLRQTEMALYNLLPQKDDGYPKSQEHRSFKLHTGTVHYNINLTAFPFFCVLSIKGPW